MRRRCSATAKLHACKQTSPAAAAAACCLQYIGNSLVNLQAMSLYNDGHVSDDGLAALAGLRCLTSLDLQGNVSITQVGAWRKGWVQMRARVRVGVVCVCVWCGWG
jgi:hypothetical protein